MAASGPAVFCSKNKNHEKMTALIGRESANFIILKLELKKCRFSGFSFCHVLNVFDWPGGC